GVRLVQMPVRVDVSVHAPAEGCPRKNSLGDLGAETPGAFGGCGVEEFPFGREVVVEGAGVDAALGSDGLHRHAAVSALAKLPLRSGEDRGTGDTAVARRRAASSPGRAAAPVGA